MQEHSLNQRRFSSSLLYTVAVMSALAIVIVGIEVGRRWRTRPDLPSSVPDPRVAKPFPRELRDAKGELLTIQNKPQRIVSETLATDEILLNICEPERIVALSSIAGDGNYSNIVDLAKQIPGRTTEGPEQILQMNSDLIFVASYSRAETVELLRQSKAPVFLFANFDSLADIKSNVRAVGFAAGCEIGAEKLIQQMDHDLAAIKAHIPRNQPPVRIMSYSRDGSTVGSETLYDEMFQFVGAVNVAAEHGIKGYATISVEKIAEWQPDYIISSANQGESENKLRQLMGDPVIATSRAGRAGHIVIIDNKHYLTISQYIVRGMEDLANGLYGYQK